MSEESRYTDVNERLKEIVEIVSDETLPLDDALDLFEEAVRLGMEASTLMEEDMAERDARAEAAEQAADEAWAAEAAEDGSPAPAEPASDGSPSASAEQAEPSDSAEAEVEQPEPEPEVEQTAPEAASETIVLDDEGAL